MKDYEVVTELPEINQSLFPKFLPYNHRKWMYFETPKWCFAALIVVWELIDYYWKMQKWEVVSIESIITQDRREQNDSIEEYYKILDANEIFSVIDTLIEAGDINLIQKDGTIYIVPLPSLGQAINNSQISLADREDI